MPPTEENEERLHGGNVHAEIIRIGDTVRRPTGPWTPGVHALLRHLERKGYTHAPRVRGFDERGREIIDYVEGTVVQTDLDLMRGDDALGEVVRAICAYHDAVADFEAQDTPSSDIGRDPTGAREILCHNDLAPWNLVRSDAGWTFIDWDLAAPGRLAWDLGWAMLSLVPFFPDAVITLAEIENRIEVFCTAYGADRMPLDVVTVAHERAAYEARLILERGALGEAPWARLLANGHADVWLRTAEHISIHMDRWSGIVLRTAYEAAAADPLYVEDMLAVQRDFAAADDELQP